MAILQMSDEEKKKMSYQHKSAIKSDLTKQADLKKALKKPDDNKTTT